MTDSQVSHFCNRKVKATLKSGAKAVGILHCINDTYTVMSEPTSSGNPTNPDFYDADDFESIDPY